MQIFFCLELNVLGIIILAVILSNIGVSYATKNAFDQLLFKFIIYSIILLFVLDFGICFFNGNAIANSKEYLLIFTSLYYILSPVPCLFWLFYSDYKMNYSLERLKKRAIYYIIPFILNFIIVIITFFTNSLFFIDEANNYVRGNLFFITPILCMMYFVYVIFIVIKKIKSKKVKGKKELFFNFLIFPLPPLVGAILQMSKYGMSLIWIGMVISILILFLNIQNKKINLDEVTGIFNRKYLNDYLTGNINISNVEIKFSLMIDIDDFKNINDSLGHLIGDEVLQRVAKILLGASDNKDNIFRFGGDEFVIFGKRESEENLKKYIDKIKRKLIEDNNNNSCKIDFSIGYSFSNKSEAPLFELINLADTKMYENKKSKKPTTIIY